MTPKIRSKNFQKCSKVGCHSCLSCQFYIIFELDPMVACAELFQAHVCCFSSIYNLLHLAVHTEMTGNTIERLMKLLYERVNG